MTERDFMRLFEDYAGEISMSDFTIAELEEMANLSQTDPQAFKRKYFEYYDDVKSPSLKKQDW